MRIFDSRFQNAEKVPIPAVTETKECKCVDEAMADAFLENAVAIEERTFILPSASPRDTKTFRVIGSGRLHRVGFWEILYDGTDQPFRLDLPEMRDLLIDSISYDD